MSDLLGNPFGSVLCVRNDEGTWIHFPLSRLVCIRVNKDETVVVKIEGQETFVVHKDDIGRFSRVVGSLHIPDPGDNPKRRAVVGTDATPYRGSIPSA